LSFAQTESGWVAHRERNVAYSATGYAAHMEAVFSRSLKKRRASDKAGVGAQEGV
jgi:hypothetical protein